MWFKPSLLHDYAFFTTSFYYIRINLLHIQEEDCINCLQNKQLTRTSICAAHSFCMKKASRLEEKCQLIFCRCWSPAYGMLQMILFCACVIWMHGTVKQKNTQISCTSFQTSLDSMHSGKVSDTASKIRMMKFPLPLVQLSRNHLHTGMTSIEISSAIARGEYKYKRSCFYNQNINNPF